MDATQQRYPFPHLLTPHEYENIKEVKSLKVGVRGDTLQPGGDSRPVDLIERFRRPLRSPSQSHEGQTQKADSDQVRGRLATGYLWPPPNHDRPHLMEPPRQHQG